MDYETMSVDELRERLKGKGVGGIWDMTKAELIDVMKEVDERDSSAPVTASDENAGERLAPGKSATTRDHDVIMRWAEARGAQPATVPGTEHGDHLGVLRFDFPGYGGESLEHVSWDLWFKTFDERDLEFLYQDQKKDGHQSNFFRLLNPNREDA